MKKLTKLVTALILVSGVSAYAQTITGFGSGDFLIGDTNSSTGFTINQTSTTSTITGVDGGTGFYVVLAAPVSVSSVSTKKLQLLATVNTANSNGFGLELFDANGASAAYTGLWSDFTANVAGTALLSFVSDAGFDGTAVAVLMSTGGTGQTINITLDNLAAVPAVVPEPSTYASLAGFAALGFVAYRRRRVSA